MIFKIFSRMTLPTLALALCLGAQAGGNQITLNNFTVDCAGANGLQALRGFAGKRAFLVQFDGAVKPAWVKALAASGLKIVASVPENAYLVYGAADAVAALGSGKAAANIPWAGSFLPKYKYHKAYLNLKDADASEWVAVQMVKDDEANAVTLTLLRQLSTTPVASAENPALGLLNARALIPLAKLSQLAAREDVIWIAPHVVPQLHCERQSQIVAANITADASAPSGPGYLAWLEGKGFDQQQFLDSSSVLVVVDDGFDNGDAASPANSEFRVGNQSGNISRVSFAEVAPGSTVALPNGPDGHGNINLSIIGGYNDGEGAAPNVDSSGYHYGLGINPFARLASTKIFEDGGYWGYPDEAVMVDSQYARGCRVSSNSWGASVGGEYTSDCQNYDTWTRDAQPAVTGNQELLFVFSAGNSGPSASTLGSPGTAKNVITVGAAESYDPGYTDGCAVGTSGADNANDIIDFSSRGPCADGRAKPDIVAPGTHIHGAASQIPTYNGSGVCDKYNPDGQTKYSESSGTSHSCPCVAGGASLVRQYFTNQGWTSPSPAMTKAYLLNSARHLNGVDSGDDLWSNNQGMGCLDLSMAFDDVGSVLRDQLAEDKFTAAGQSNSYVYNIADTTKPFRVTLGWTDAPGSVVAPSYNNDLNLTVTVGGITYLGNHFSGAISTPGGSADLKNNVESVFLPAGLSGRAIVTVTAFKLTSDGVPGDADPVDQDFALVAHNATSSNIHTVRFVPGSNGSITGTTFQSVLNGENCTPVAAIPDTGYYFDRWTGGLDSVDSTLTVTKVTADMTIVANFVAQAPYHVAPGSVFSVNVASALTKTPKVMIETGTTAKVLTSSKAFKGGLNTFSCQWTNTKEGPMTHTLYVNGDTAVASFFSIEQPYLTSLSTNSNTGKTIVTVTGKFFGSNRPTVYMAYPVNGQMKQARCTLDKPLYPDAKNKPGKSYMDLTTGDSTLVFPVPKKITTGMAATLVIKFNFTGAPITVPFSL